MLKLNDGRNELWQWDTGRKLTVDADCSQVHFSNKVFGRSVDVDVADGVAIVPDILLQVDKELTSWAFVGTAENGYTKISKVFKVNKRNKPADYVFTPPEQTTLQELVERLAAIEEIQDPDAIKNAVEDYLEQNPVKSPVQSVNGKIGDVKLTAEDVGAISQDKLQEATNKALAQAKTSGEFDGSDGKSAYQIAVDNGFEGSEAEWLESLKGGGGGTSVSDAVLYTEQALTPEQQEQARKNIGAITADETNIFYGRTASFYGDSLTEVNSHYTKGYHKWIKEILGLASYNNYGKSGYKISDIYSKVSSVSDSPDVVFVMGGANDQSFSVPLGTIGDSSPDTTYGALNLLCGLLKQKYPTSIVVFITPHYQTKYPHDSGITSYEVSKAIREVCEKYAITVYDNFVLSGIYSTNLSAFTTDNCHWNNSAHEMVGKNLARFMANTFRYIHGDCGNTSVTMITGMEITGVQFANQYHISLYVTSDDLPAITNVAPVFGFTMEPLTDFIPKNNRTGGIYTVDTVNNLGSGFTDVPNDNHEAKANIVNNGDGTYSVTMTQSVLSYTADRAFWCFPINMQLVTGNKFNITNAFVNIGDTRCRVHAIGGTFVGETFTTD